MAEPDQVLGAKAAECRHCGKVLAEADHPVHSRYDTIQLPRVSPLVTTRPARDLVLTRLLEVLLIEALRSMTGTAALPGLLRGLADPRLAAAIRQMHERPGHAWTVSELASEAALYLHTGWREATAPGHSGAVQRSLARPVEG